MEPESLSLELTRLLGAPRASVLEYFTDAALLAEWWGPHGYSIPSIEFTPHVGATYRIEMQPPEGQAFALTGTFRQVDRSHLAFTFTWQPADPDDQETLAQLSFGAINNSTEVRLEQGPFKTEARRELHRAGWTDSFDRLAEVIANPG